VTAESLYRSAEAALGKHDLAAADRALARLVADFATSPLVDEAIYERARIAYQRHAWSDARRLLEQLAQDRSSPLADPGAYLACRIAYETHDEGAARCLTDYRAAYPSSPHDVDVLGLLVDLAYRDGGCARATPVIDELAHAHPRASLVKAWRSRCEAPK
jgi:outer membrane protein assembly factor BamD (BamD/ComL family)